MTEKGFTLKSVILESLDDLSAAIDNFTARFDDIDREIRVLGDKIVDVENRLDSLSEDVENRLDSLSEDIRISQRSLESMESDVSSMSSSLTDLERQVNSLEENLPDLQEIVQNMQREELNRMREEARLAQGKVKLVRLV